jgi:hypothetical protein
MVGQIYRKFSQQKWQGRQTPNSLRAVLGLTLHDSQPLYPNFIFKGSASQFVYCEAYGASDEYQQPEVLDDEDAFACRLFLALLYS